MSMLLSRNYEDVLAAALVSPAFEFDGTEDTYDFLREVGPDDGPVIDRTSDGYAFQAIETNDEPAVVLISPTGQPCGFYWRFMSWIDEVHRGRGFGVEMILAYADHFQDLAWEGDIDECAQGLGFSERGFSIHLTAQRIAMIRENGVDRNEISDGPPVAFC